MNRALLIALLVGAPMIALVALGLTVRAGYDSEQSVERAFAIDEPFDVVRKVLVRKDVSKQIIVAGGTSEFIDQEWDDLDIGLESLNLAKDWRIQRTGKLRLRTTDDYIGRQEILLDQKVVVVNDYVDSRVVLGEPTGRLLDYVTTTRFERNDQGATTVTLTLQQRIHTHAPFFFGSVADKQVRESAEASLEKQEAAVRRVIDEHKAEFLEDETAEAGPGERRRPLRGLLKKLLEAAGEELAPQEGENRREGGAPAEPADESA